MRVLTKAELEALAAEVETDAVVRKLTEAEKFILSLNIEAGPHPVTCDVIYAKYFSWRKGDKLTKKQFFRQFKSHFQSKRNNKGIIYFLNKESLGLTDEEYWKARRVERDQQQIKNIRKQVKEKNRQKEREASGIKQ